MPRARGSPQGSWAWEAVKAAIETLEAHTVCSSERWIGHPSIPLRVFGPTEYLDEPPKQLTKPQTAMMPRLDTDDPSFNTQALSSSADFQPTQQEGSLHGPKELSLGQKFAQWFDFTFIDYSPVVRQKAIKASQEATCHTLFKTLTQCNGLPGPDPGQQPADLVYAPETQDVRYRKERGSGEPVTISQTLSQQEELNHL